MASQTRPQRDSEEELLRSVAIQNAQAILLARQRAEEELVRAKEALEKKTAELARSLAMMRATLDATSDGILAIDQSGRISAHNEKFAEMWHVPREVLDARDNPRLLQAVAPQVSDHQGFLDRVREIYEIAPNETYDLLELRDGRVFERFSRVQIIDDRVVGRVWTFRDITERRRAEEALQKAADERKQLLESERAARGQAERTSSMKDEFLATLSHELRTPLSAILGWAQVLRMRAMSPEELNQGLTTIERNARVQTQLIEDLLDMSRITSGKVRLDIQPVDPIITIEAALESVRPAADARGIRLEKLLDPKAGPISADPGRVQQIVWNLLTNAIKFTPKDGKVQIILQRVNSHIEIKVADTGIGIRPEFLPYVFDRFRQADASTTRKYGGLGLGLSIVKHLVELHGGTVWAASAGEGRGTTFCVHLPLLVVHRSADDGERQHPRSERPSSMEFTPSNLEGVRVLVVDDEPDARTLIRRVLEECGAEVRTSPGGVEALRQLEDWRPDVLLSDIGMPVMDGYELLRRTRALGSQRGGKVPAVALTAFARTEDRTRALRAGFIMHVSKPVEPSELVAAVASIIGRTGESGS
jgi:PAS domain S-box-containing protein